MVLRVNINQYLALNPCYDPRGKDPSLAEPGREGEVIEILDMTAFPVRDRIIAVLKFVGQVNETFKREYYIGVTRALMAKFPEGTFSASFVDAIDTAESFLNGGATDKELKVARSETFAEQADLGSNTDAMLTAKVGSTACFFPGADLPRPNVTPFSEETFVSVLKSMLVAKGYASPQP